MLNYDINENPSVDLLEKLVRQLVNETETQLRIDGLRPESIAHRGIHSHLKRIGEHVVKRGLVFFTPDDVGTTAFDDFLTKIDKSSIIVVEGMREDFIEARSSLALAGADGYKIITTYWENA
jgi:hypothetical protein